MKVWQYIALMSKGRIENDQNKVYKYLLENFKNTCDIITDLMKKDLCKNNFFVENCEEFKDCRYCLSCYLNEEVEDESLQGM